VRLEQLIRRARARAAARVEPRADAYRRRAAATPTWVVAKRRLRDRRILSADQVAAMRRSQTVFIFGSGGSLNEIPAAEWEQIARHDTFGFNWFMHQAFVRCDFHLIRQMADGERALWEPQLREYCSLIDSNPRYDETVLLVQHEWQARGANLALQLGIFPHRQPVLPWHTNRVDSLSRSFADGLVHGSSTLFDSVNAAYLLGWGQIVLVGVDLYDRRYFWLPDGETRGVDRLRSASFADAHTQASSGLTEYLRGWAQTLAEDGVGLSVYNPRSLLAEALPIFEADWRSVAR
jgi:hypothetical protein